MPDKTTTNANAYLAFDVDANQIPTKVKSSFLPAPTATNIGAVKAGMNISIAADGTISSTTGGGDVLSGAVDPTTAPTNTPALYFNTVTRVIWEWGTGASAWVKNTLSLDDLSDVAISDQPVTFWTQLTANEVTFFGQAVDSGNRWAIRVVIPASSAALLTTGSIVSATNDGTQFTVLNTTFVSGSTYQVTFSNPPVTTPSTWNGQTGTIGGALWLAQTSSLADGEVVTWDAASSKWVARILPPAQVTNSLTSAVNVMTSTVSGVSSQAAIVTSNAISKPTDNTLRTTVNQQNSVADVNIIDANSLTNPTPNTLRSNINGIISTPDATIIDNAFTTNGLAYSSNQLTATINGVTSNAVTITGGGGSSTLESLTDVQVTEPTYSQVSTFTVASVSSGTNSITLSATASGLINVGDWLRGGTTVPPSTLGAIEVIGLFGANLVSLEFRSDPSSYFTAGNNVYRLPGNLDENNLQWSNAAARWIGVPSASPVGLDSVTWIDRNQKIYATNVSIAIQTVQIITNLNNLMNSWTFSVPTIPGITDNASVVLIDQVGRIVSGTYVSGAQTGGNAALEQVLYDRIAGGGFVVNTAYTMQLRQGTEAISPLVQKNTSFLPVYDRPYLNVHVANQTEFWGYLREDAGYSNTGSILTTTAYTNDDEVQGVALTWTGGNPPANLANGSSVIIFDTQGRFNISEGVLNQVSGNWFIEGAFNCNYLASIQSGTYPVVIYGVSENANFNLNGLYDNAQLVAGTGIALSVNNNDITINSTGGGAGGGASTIYIQELADDIVGEGFLQSTRAGRAYLGVAMGINVTGGVIQGVTYIQASTMEQAYGFAMRMPTSIGGSAVAYSDLTFRISQPTFNNIVIPINITGGTGTPAFYLEPVLVNASYWASGDPYLNVAQFPLLASPGSEGTQLQPIHAPTFGAVTTGSGTATISSISGGYWAYTVPPNTAYTGTNTGWIVLWAISPSDDSGPTFTITGDPNSTTFLNNGDIEIDLALGSGGGGSTPSLAQVLAVGNTTGNNNIALTGTGKLSGPVGNLNITGGANGQVLTTDGAGNQSWTTVSGGGGGGVNVPVINFTSSATPSAGQTFTNVALATYTNANQLSVTVNGSTLSSDQYSLAGSVLTINAYLLASSAVQVQPANAGGSGGDISGQIAAALGAFPATVQGALASAGGATVVTAPSPAWVYDQLILGTTFNAVVRTNLSALGFELVNGLWEFPGTLNGSTAGSRVFISDKPDASGSEIATLDRILDDGDYITFHTTDINAYLVGRAPPVAVYIRVEAFVFANPVEWAVDNHISDRIIAGNNVTLTKDPLTRATTISTPNVPNIQSNQAVYTVSANLQGATTSAQGQFVNLITQRVNNLGFSLNFAMGRIENPVANAVYQLFLQAYNKINTTVVNAEIFYSCNTSTSTTSFVSYGNGVGISNPINVNNRITDYIANSAVGYWIPASTSEVLYFNYYIDPLTASNMLNVQLQLTITRIS